MCILIANGETLAIDLTYSTAMREAKYAARLLGTTITIFNIQTGSVTKWK